MKCVHCDNQHPSYFSYCPNTSNIIDATLAEKYTYHTMEFCSSCGGKNTGESSFCSSCGITLLKREQRKTTIDKLLNQGLSNIPLKKVNVGKHLNTENIKTASKVNVDYIKKNKLILAPILISIGLTILLAFFIYNTINSNLKDVAQLVGEDEIGMLLDAKMLENLIYEETDAKVNIPDFPIYSTIIMMIHGVDYTFEGRMFAEEGGEETSFAIDNILYGLLIIPLLALTIGAVIYGILAKKHGWSFWKGIGYSTAVYTLFLLIMSFVARYRVDVSFKDYYDGLIVLDAKIVPSILDLLVSGAVLATLVYSFVGYISYHGKSTITKLSSDLKYIQYAMYMMAATVVGLIIHYVQGVVVFKKEMENFGYGMFDYMDVIPDSLSYIMGGYLGTTNWLLSLFSKIQIGVSSLNYSEVESYKWYLNSGGEKFFAKEFQDYTLLVSPVFLIILAAVILGGVGYLLYSRHQLDYIEIAILSGIFTLIQCIILYFSNIEITGNVADEDGRTILQFALLNTVLGAFILSYISVYLGGFLRKSLNK